MPFRFLPRTDHGHLEALETAQRKVDSLAPGQRRLLSPGTETGLRELLPRFLAEVAGRDEVIGHQTGVHSQPA